MPQNTNEYGPGNQAKLKKISGRPTKMGNPMANTLMGDPNPMGDMGDMGGSTVPFGLVCLNNGDEELL